MASQPTPSSPTNTHNSTSSYSLIQSLDNLSLSTGSFDLISNPSSQSASQQCHSTTTSQRSQSAHSRQSSGSVISAPGSYEYDNGLGEGRRMSISEDDEVVLIPRSLASSVMGGSVVGRTSRTGMTLSDQIRESLSRAGSAAKGTAPSPKPRAGSMGGDSSLSEASYIAVPADDTSASESPLIGLSASELRNIDQFAKIKAKTLVKKRRQKAAWRAQADRDPAAFQGTVDASWSDPEVRQEYERFRREKIKRKLKLKRAAQKEGADLSASQAGSVSGEDIRGEGMKGKGKGKAKSRGKGKASKGDTPSAPNSQTAPTTYNISGIPTVIDQTALTLLTGGRAPAPVTPTSAVPPTPKLQQASLQKLHLLDLLNNGSTSGSSAGGSRAEDEDSSSDEDEEGDEEGSDVLTDLGTPEVYMDLRGSTPRSGLSSVSGSGVGSQRRRRAEGSIVSADDARSSIDDFMLNPRQRLNKEETLRFWQSLCYELGLADLDDDLPDLPTSHHSESTYTDSTSSRSTTPTQISRPMPQNLFTAKALLKAEGHVNIADYFEARKADQEAAAAAAAGAAAEGEEGIKVEPAQEEGPGKYAHLVQNSAGSMKKYTRSSGRFVQLDWVKAEAMQPLLRDFGFKRGRERRGEMQ